MNKLYLSNYNTIMRENKRERERTNLYYFFLTKIVDTLFELLVRGRGEKGIQREEENRTTLEIIFHLCHSQDWCRKKICFLWYFYIKIDISLAISWVFSLSFKGTIFFTAWRFKYDWKNSLKQLLNTIQSAKLVNFNSPLTFLIHTITTLDFLECFPLFGFLNSLLSVILYREYSLNRDKFR